MAGTLIDSVHETDYFYDPEEEDDDIDISLLRLNSFGSSSDRRRANSSPPQFQSYGSFGSSSYSTAAATTTTTSPVKRPSPESKEVADEPRRKKLLLPGSEEDEKMSNLMGYLKVPLPMDCNPNRIRSYPLYKRSLSDTFASPAGSGFGSGYTRNGFAQETAPPSGNNAASPSLPPRPRPPLFRRSVSDVSPAPSKSLIGSSRFGSKPETNLVNPENSEANKMLFVIKDGVRELDQWCNKLLKYNETIVSSSKQDDISPKVEEEEEEERQEEEEEEQRKDCKEGVKVDRVGEAFVVEINCPCGRNYRTLFSGRDCYYKLL